MSEHNKIVLKTIFSGLIFVGAIGLFGLLVKNSSEGLVVVQIVNTQRDIDEIVEEFETMILAFGDLQPQKVGGEQSLWQATLFADPDSLHYALVMMGRERVVTASELRFAVYQLTDWHYPGQHLTSLVCFQNVYAHTFVGVAVYDRAELSVEDFLALVP